MRGFGIFAALAMTTGVARADVRLPAILSDNMLLQSGASIPVWGWAAAGEAVSVEFAGQRQQTVAGVDGKWSVRLSPLATNTAGELKVTGKNEVTVRNVLCGEVWLAAGQSNMVFPMFQEQRAKELIPEKADKSLRLFKVETAVAAAPAEDVKGQWVECSPESVKNFSAVGYLFGNELRGELKQPVGIVCAAVGGTWAQAWTSQEALVSDPGFAKAFNWYQAEYAKVPPKSNPQAPNRLSGLFNGMVSPLMPFGIRGVIWYQGEANAFVKPRYTELMTLLIMDWRRRWGQGDFPFLIVQLPNFADNPNFVGIREEQAKLLSLPGTDMAVTIDCGTEHDIHPRDKSTVAHRLALMALGRVYSRPVEWRGPSLDKVTFEGDKAKVTFFNGQGLNSKGGELLGFELAGVGRVFKPAQGRIVGNSVELWAEGVGEPVAVRYAWSANPRVSLVNGAGLPAGPFRTDGWE